MRRSAASGSLNSIILLYTIETMRRRRNCTRVNYYCGEIHMRATKKKKSRVKEKKRKKKRGKNEKGVRLGAAVGDGRLGRGSTTYTLLCT